MPVQCGTFVAYVNERFDGSRAPRRNNRGGGELRLGNYILCALSEPYPWELGPLLAFDAGTTSVSFARKNWAISVSSQEVSMSLF